MKKFFAIALVAMLCAGPLRGEDKPIYSAVNVEVGSDFVIRDFIVYPYSSSYLMGYSRLHYSGFELIDYVRLDCRLYRKGALAGTAEFYGDYATYGRNGMRPGCENFYASYIDRVEFDSVAFSITFRSGDGLQPHIDKEGLKVTTARAEEWGPGKKISGLLRNVSGSAIAWPSILICLYREGQLVQYCQAFAEAPGHLLLPGQSASFSSYIGSAPYDAIVYLSNTALPEKPVRSLPRVGMQTASNPVLFYMSQI
ncbi:MAG TPA: hypothetical protein PKY55_16870 [bacterium]|nr:hypothetical protein [bacterium]HPG84956.1 hypothetical protein [bacterium]